jgi:hypothetical protein
MREAIMQALVYHGPGQKAWEEVAESDVFGDAASGALKVVLTREEEEEGGAR